MLERSDYVYANMRIKCLEDKNLDFNDFEAMLSITSFTDRVGYLKNKGWVFDDSLTEIDSILKKCEKDLFSFVKELVGSLDFLNFILIKKDFSNLKTIIRGVLSEIDISDLLDDLSLISPETLLNCVKNQSFTLLPDYIKDAAKESFETLLHTNDACIADTIIDSHMFKVLNKISTESKLSIVKNYVELFFVYANLNISLRAENLKKNNRDFLAKALVPCRTFDRDKIMFLTIKGKEALLDYLSGLSYTGFLPFLCKEGKDYLNCWFDSSLLNIVKREQSNYFTKGPIVAYVLSKYLEFKKIRLIFSSYACNEKELNSIRERLKAA